MKKKTTDKKRKYARLTIQSKVNFSLVETGKSGKTAPKSNRFSATGKDLGVEGMVFTSDTEIKKGTLIDLEIFTPDKKEPSYLAGEIRWCKPSKEKKGRSKLFDVGVKFLFVEKDHIISLLKYVCGGLEDDRQESLL